MTKTKIICTMGPSSASQEAIENLIDAGMSVARINFSHGTHADHERVINTLKRAREKKKGCLAILLDTKGPEVRLGLIEGGQFSVEKGDRIPLVAEAVSGLKQALQILPAAALDVLEVGQRVLIDDGYIEADVVERQGSQVIIEVLNSGSIKAQKGVCFPGVQVDLPAMTEQDIEDIRFGVLQGIDLIAASFIRSKEHILEIKKLLSQEKASHIQVLAKIENPLGVQNFDEILEAADGIMVARGDLGVELPLKEVPRLQKMMIRKCYRAGKSVVTATQMLESMIQNPRPTRAEVSDVANAIYDSTSAVMLSGETAVGRYPVETVQLMQSVVDEAEKDFDYRTFFNINQQTDFRELSSAIALAAVRTAYSIGAKAIFCFTHSGFTARHVSRFRPRIPIFALTSDEKVHYQLAVEWGVIAVDPKPAANVQEALSIVSKFAVDKGALKPGDLVVVTAGSPFGQVGSTNTMLVETI